MNKVLGLLAAFALGASSLIGTATPAFAAPDIICGLRDRGCYQVQGDTSLYYTKKTGPAVVKGAIREHWGRRGWEKGFLGYPTNYETCGLSQNGCWSDFQGGAIYYAPNPGAHFVRGAIREKWGLLGWERSHLQYTFREKMARSIGKIPPARTSSKVLSRADGQSLVGKKASLVIQFPASIE